MSAVDLLPCPFCGCDDIARVDGPSEDDWVTFSCRRCFSRGPLLSYTDMNAMRAWNRRVPVSAGKVKALVWDKWGDAKGGGAKYSVYEFGGRGLWNCVCYPHEDQQYRLAYGVSQDAAKAAAQADYEARILPALQPGDGWQGIESAPKDGRWIVGWFDFGPNDKRAICIRWDAPARHRKFPWLSDGGRFAETCLYLWAPLPASLPQGEETR